MRYRKRMCQNPLMFTVLVFIGLTFLCAAQPNESRSFDEHRMTLERLNKLLAQIDPWPDMGTNYSTASWARLISASKEIEECDQASVEGALKDFYNSSYADKFMPPPGSTNIISFEEQERRRKDDGKLFLLMRVLFDLPERATNSMEPKFYAWSIGDTRPETTDLNVDGTFNIAWPIRWNRGNPELITGETGIEGPVNIYDPFSEYAYFKTQYKFRKLVRD